MALYFDSVVSGTAAVDLPAPSHVIFVAADITVMGPGVGQLGQDLGDHRSRVGWFQLGDHFDIGEGAIDRWREPVWINWDGVLWTPVPSTDSGGGALSVVAPRMRYWFSAGTSVRLYIYGT